MKLTSKEKKELGLIFGSVLLVAIVGLIVSVKMDNTAQAFAGAATTINPDLLTDSGMLALLNEHCEPVTGSGTCKNLCGARLCLPLEEDCAAASESNQCLCCTV